MKALILTLLATLPTIAHAKPAPAGRVVCELFEAMPETATDKGGLKNKREFRFDWTDDAFGDSRELESTLFPGMKLTVNIGSGAVGKERGLAGFILWEDEVTGASGADTFHLNYIETRDGNIAPASSLTRAFNRNTKEGKFGLVLFCDVNQSFRP